MKVCLVVWLVGCLVGWLFGWLIVCEVKFCLLVGWLVVFWGEVKFVCEVKQSEVT